MLPGSDTVCSWARILESRLDPVKQFYFRWRWTGASFYRAKLALPLSGHTHPLLIGLSRDGEVRYLLETETRLHSCLACKTKTAGWRRRQEEARPWTWEDQPRSD